MRSIGECIALSQTRQMGMQYHTWHIPLIAQKGSSPHEMSCPSKGITLCQSLMGTQGEFLCNIVVNTSHVSLLSFLASNTRYDLHKWPHESTLFCPYL